MFRIIASNTNDTVSLRHWSHFWFQDMASAQCVYNSTTYLTVPLDIVLSSDSLYHLSDQTLALIVGRNYQLLGVIINCFMELIYIFVFKQVWICFWEHACIHAESFYPILECEDKSQLYDFTTHKCVYECPACGFAPFRFHHTAYCRTS